ncbi:Nitrogen permease regulator 2 [Tilletia horrida]|nr:Nitrogen permease regulator 2 [Tilletia horrida]
MPLPGLLGGAFDVESNAFLDIQAIFFSVFDPTRGPRILFQMPEGSITQDDSSPAAGAGTGAGAGAGAGAPGVAAANMAQRNSSSGSAPAEPSFSSPPAAQRGAAALRTLLNEELPDSSPGSGAASPGGAASEAQSASRARRRSSKRTDATQYSDALFDFGPIKDYIIPKKQLCGRLVACNIRGRSSTTRSSHLRNGGSKPVRSSFSSSSRRSDSFKLRSESVSRSVVSDIGTDVVIEDDEDAEEGMTPPIDTRPTRRYRILGFPVFLSDESRYARNDFRFNMCFVFDASADTRPYEPVVRKVARILTGLEESSCFLSNEKNLQRVHGIIEQLYQDLNAYCESFVPLPVAPHTSYVPATTNATAVGTPTAGAGTVPPGNLFIATSSGNQLTSSVIHTANQSTVGTSTQHSPHMPSGPIGSSPSPSRISNLRGRRRGRTIDGLRRDASGSFSATTPISGAAAAAASANRSASATAAGFASPGPVVRLTTGSPATPDVTMGDVTVTTTSDDAPLSPEAAADAKLKEWEKELPHGLGRTVRDAINIKLFPIYPNPPAANDWDVPVALLDLRSRVDANWDLTMAKIFPFIDGVNHVKKIAELADADLGLTRQCMEHLLYYECIIMIDLFQYSNIYTLRPLIASVATLDSIQRECADYVTRPGKTRPPYTDLLALYAKALRPGLTVSQWMEDLLGEVEAMHLDVRRFVTFGVIKGFVRRVHRFPIYIPPAEAPFPLPITNRPNQLDLSMRSTGLAPVADGLEKLLIAGTHCDDELCVRFGLSWHQLEGMLLTLGYGQHELAEEMARQRAQKAAAAAAAAASAGEDDRQSYTPGSAWVAGSGTGWGMSGPSGQSAAGWSSGTRAGASGSSGVSGRYAQGGSAHASGSGEAAYLNAWGSQTSTADSTYSTGRRTSGAPTIYASQYGHNSSSRGPPSSRSRYPSDAGWGAGSSFGAQMSGFFNPQHSHQHRGSDATAIAPIAGGWPGSRSDAHGDAAGAAGGMGAFDRVTGERLPANARPQSPEPMPGPDWHAIYAAARKSGHMGDVQIFLR